MGNWDELKRLAEKATSGPWRAIDYGSYDGSEECWYVETSAGPADIFDCMDGTIEPNHWNPARGKADMQFIAAANPAAILALIAEVECLRKELGRD